MTTDAQAPTLAQAIAQFLADPTTGTGYTLRTYATGLKRLLAYVASTGAPADQAPVTLISLPFALAWITWLLEDQLVSERTLHTYLAAFSRFVRFLHNRAFWDKIATASGDKTAAGPTHLHADDVLRLQAELRQVRRVHRPPSRQVRVPSEEDVAALVRAARAGAAADQAEDVAARGDLRRLRDIAMLELLRSSGIRVGELVSLRRRDLEPAPAGQAPPGRLRVMGKGRKERWAYADADAWAAMRAYLQARASLDGHAGKSLGGLPLFARHDKGAGASVLPLTTRSVQIVIEKLARRAGLVEQGISPHSLRHYFATRLLRVTGNLAVVQDLLDHRSPETTRIYAAVDETQKRQAHEQAFARNGASDER